MNVYRADTIEARTRVSLAGFDFKVRIFNICTPTSTEPIAVYTDDKLYIDPDHMDQAANIKEEFEKIKDEIMDEKHMWDERASRGVF